MAEKKATIRDVAKKAGVSVASVSYTLNGIDKVSPETKERIFRAIEELNYKPSLTAQCLSKGDSKLIGISLPITEKGDIPGMLLENNPFFGEFISGVESVTRKAGYDILISGVETNEHYSDWVMRRKLDGIIMVGAYPKSIFEEIKTIDVPIVLTDTYEDYASDFHRVMVEDEKGGYMAVKHLLELGHRRIGYVTGSIDNSLVNYNRYSGYRKALLEAGITPEREWFFEEHVTFDGGYAIAKDIMEKQNVTAVFVAADIMAIGIIKYFLERGKNVPGDISVVGFDDIKIGQYMMPGLTTIRQDIIMKGRVSAEMIMKDIGLGRRTNDSFILSPSLVIRDSTSAL
ncbi:MAG: LacI family DNA-binding transcriptional regulator [Lachnospiraceae bacterium]|nr:LacI family DNA-binding transcriptional regulator [Lachnospiraceae bacterium]MBQ9886742.1 LacI family DNA-binding transcriptional regulator [Lachnospiraceae bacterium]